MRNCCHPDSVDIHPDHEEYFQLLKLSPNDLKIDDDMFNDNLIFSSYIDISSRLYQEQNDIVDDISDKIMKMSNNKKLFFKPVFPHMVDNFIVEKFEKKQNMIKEAYQMLEMTYGIPEPDHNVYYTETGKFIDDNDDYN
jgi:hypothetical protein